MVSYKFRVSNRKDKKYDALLDDGRIVSFGAIKRDGEPYDQFKDSTPLRVYHDFDHNDPKRRERYYKRHKINYPMYSADWFSKKYLW
jgi:hypothetical protein